MGKKKILNPVKVQLQKSMNVVRYSRKPKNGNKNEIALQAYGNLRDVSVKLVNFLDYPPSEILEISAKKISEGKCQTYDVNCEALKEISEISRNSCNKKKKENEKIIMELRKKISSLQSQLKNTKK